MLIVFLGFIDVISSIAVFLTLGKITALTGIGIFFSIFLVIKFLISIVPDEKSIFGGLIDIMAAIVIILSSWGIYIHYIIVLLVGFFLLLKGIQSIIPEVLG